LSGNCYLCGKTRFKRCPGQVRDMPQLDILRCQDCGLVFLSSTDHIGDGFYDQSGMHGQALLEVNDWLAEVDVDDRRRLASLEPLLPGCRLLDFGCGVGGFLAMAGKLAQHACGVEPEIRLQAHFADRGLAVFKDLETLREEKPEARFDLITLFHVLEHLPDPRRTLGELAALLADGGRVVIEVPSADDALLSLYQCEAFARFHYWSCHLYLFNPQTLTELVRQSGLQLEAVRQLQRYPLSNHLHWLARGRAGGHRQWCFLDSPALETAYAQALAAVGRCDTLLAFATV